MGSHCIAASLTAAAGAFCPAAACKAAATGRFAAPSTIASAAAVAEAMATPAVTIAPAGPWAHAQEDAAVKVSRPVKSIGRAGIRRIVIIAVRTDGWNADVNDELSLNNWRQGQAR